MAGRVAELRRTYLEAHMDDRKSFSRTTISAHDTVSSGTDSSAFLGPVFSHTLIATASSSFPARRHKKRGSLSALIGNLPKDISLLIRSHSSSRRPLRQIQDTHDSASDMLQDDERPTRKTFRENRLYRFITRSLTRSRSRSRSRTGRDTPPPIDPNEPVPNIPPSHNGRARTDSMGQSGPSKPITRIPSRPLSSTTTATNITVTPTTPRAKKRPPSAIPVSKDSTSRPTLAKGPSPRKKLHTIFGIPLSSAQKSSFTSPSHDNTRPSPDVAPSIPGRDEFEDDDPTPKALKYFPQSHYRSESPSPAGQQKLGHNPGNGSAGTSTSGSSRLPRFLNNGGQKTPPPPSADIVSAPIGRPSTSSHRRGNSASTSNSNRSSPSSAPDTTPAKAKAADSMALPPIPVPRIAYTPPTPQQERPGLPGPAPELAKSSSLGHSSRKNSADSSHGTGGEDGLGELNGHARVRMGHSRGHSRRSTKHGSFDFERPGWRASMQRTVSGATTGSGTSTTGNNWGRGLDGIRESAMGPGLAGVGTLQRDVSLRRGKEREEMLNRMREEERRKRRAEIQCKEATVAQEFGVLPPRSQTLQTPAARALSSEDPHTTVSGKSSSWGKKQGTLLGKANVTTLGVSLGPFAFEPPVPSPTWSTASAGNVPSNGKDTPLTTPLTVSWAEQKGRDKLRIKADMERDKERWLDREKERRSHSAQRGDRAPVPVPVTSATMGHRSGMKGRSLDLGLGLSWAPSSVREDALLPSSVLLSRSISGSSSLHPRSVGKSVSGSANGHSTIEESPVLASEVAKVFKTTLDEMGYKTFKRYIDRFDAHEIPFDGPTGIVARVERLLASVPNLNKEDRGQLLENFIRVVLQHA